MYLFTLTIVVGSLPDCQYRVISDSLKCFSHTYVESVKTKFCLGIALAHFFRNSGSRGAANFDTFSLLFLYPDVQKTTQHFTIFVRASCLLWSATEADVVTLFSHWSRKQTSFDQLDRTASNRRVNPPPCARFALLLMRRHCNLSLVVCVHRSTKTHLFSFFITRGFLLFVRILPCTAVLEVIARRHRYCTVTSSDPVNIQYSTSSGSVKQYQSASV